MSWKWLKRAGTQVSWRHNFSNICLVFIVGVGGYYLVLAPLTRFIDASLRESLDEGVANIQRICEQSYADLLRSGIAPDSAESRVKQAFTLALVEDFLAANHLELFLTAGDKVLMTPRSIPDFPGAPDSASSSAMGPAIESAVGAGKVSAFPASALAGQGRISGGDEGEQKRKRPALVTLDGGEFYIRRGSFSPWQWRFVLFKNSKQFAGVLTQLRYAYIGGGTLLLSWFLLSAYLFRRQIQEPINEIISTLQQGEKPGYKGVYEFEFLSRRLAATMGEQELMRRRFFHQQKLESIGVLAGGIAHDFNNLLTALYGQISLASMILPQDSQAREHLLLAEKSADRARSLTSQLLAFSTGGSALKRRPIPVHQLLRETAEFVLSGSGCSLNFQADELLGEAELDRDQMGNVFHNLILNAREAMENEDQGVIEISCENIEVVELQKLPLLPGNYVLIKIRDNGGGIEAEVMERIFDPYFTTKERGARKGTGLGLAICHSIVSAHGGHIEVSSSPGQGSLFTLYLPAASDVSDHGTPYFPARKTPGPGRE